MPLIVFGRSDLREDYPPTKSIAYANWEDLSDQAKAIVIEAKLPRILMQEFPRYSVEFSAMYTGELIDWDANRIETMLNPQCNEWLKEELWSWIETYDGEFGEDYPKGLTDLHTKIDDFEEPLTRAELEDIIIALWQKFSDGG